MFWIQFQIDDYFAFRPKLGFLSAHLFQNYLTNYLWRKNFVTDRDDLISGSFRNWTVHWIKVYGPSRWNWSVVSERNYLIDSCINVDNILPFTVNRYNRYNWAVVENGRSSKKTVHGIVHKDRNRMVFEDTRGRFKNFYEWSQDQKDLQSHFLDSKLDDILGWKWAVCLFDRTS